MQPYAVLLMGERNPADIEGGFRTVRVDTAAEAAAAAHPVPPSSTRVETALVFAVAEPWSPTRVELVRSLEWGSAVPARPSEREADRLIRQMRARHGMGE